MGSEPVRDDRLERGGGRQWKRSLVRRVQPDAAIKPPKIRRVW
jgi:hypothetical protein